MNSKFYALIGWGASLWCAIVVAVLCLPKINRVTLAAVSPWLAIAVAVLCAVLSLVGCRNPYPTCSQEGQERCKDERVEICVGGHWYASHDCGDVVIIGDQEVKQYKCHALDGFAECLTDAEIEMSKRGVN